MCVCMISCAWVWCYKNLLFQNSSLDFLQVWIMLCAGLQIIQMQIKNLERIKLGLACLFALWFHVHVCVSLKFFFFPISIKLVAWMHESVLWFHANAKPSELEP
jgi:hypothetical protein